MSKAVWNKDEGYCGCKTARFGSIAVVVCPPDFSGSWGYQAFDESSWDAVESGATCAEGFGFESEQSVIEYVEDCMGC